MTAATAINVSLLHDIRTLRDLMSTTRSAMHECENHRQAGYDTGYFAQYSEEFDRLSSAYYTASHAEDQQLSDLIGRHNMDDDESSRAYWMARRYS